MTYGPLGARLVTEEIAMQDEQQKREELLGILREEVVRLLSSDDVSEEEKVTRMKRAQNIIESGEV